ncbi:MAG TPA: DinB family protein [Bryobacteraceae bacterium]|nr:DinB family protein [Bryobacteraceae bacterium]
MTISETLLPEFDQEMANTRKLLECVPDGKWDWKPHPKSMTLGRLAGHVAELPGWATNTIRLSTLKIDPTDASFQPFFAKSRQDLVATFDKNVAEARDAIAAATDDHLHQMWSLEFGGKTVMSMPRAAVLRSVVMNHLIHHRAQLGLFLRLNDVAIPGMYGPSADEGRMFAG